MIWEHSGRSGGAANDAFRKWRLSLLKRLRIVGWGGQSVNSYVKLAAGAGCAFHSLAWHMELGFVVLAGALAAEHCADHVSGKVKRARSHQSCHL